MLIDLTYIKIKMSHLFEVIQYLVCSFNHKQRASYNEMSANWKFSTLFPYYSFTRKHESPWEVFYSSGLSVQRQ